MKTSESTSKAKFNWWRFIEILNALFKAIWNIGKDHSQKNTKPRV